MLIQAQFHSTVHCSMPKRKEKVDEPAADDTPPVAVTPASPPSQVASAAAVARPVTIPVGYSADRAECEIRALKEEARELTRRAERGQASTTDRMRSIEIQGELKEKRTSKRMAPAHGQAIDKSRRRAKLICRSLVSCLLWLLRLLEAILARYRKHAQGMAVLALGVLLFLGVVWILLGWDSPIAWMESMNKENRHRDMMKATGGPSYKPQ
jgi:hypothetical protein